MSKRKGRTGTREWAKKNINVVLGCSHDCRYCYGADMALRLGRIEKREDWATEKPVDKNLMKCMRKYKGVVMFPTTHDVTPGTLDLCTVALQQLLNIGNRVLLCTKADIGCLRHILEHCHPWQEQLEVRITCGTLNTHLAGYWEPGAPSPQERMDALMCASAKGWRTSVSAEPCLSWLEPDVDELVAKACRRGAETVWLGLMNRMATRVAPDHGDAGHGQAMRFRMGQGQREPMVQAAYDRLHENPAIRWKKEVRDLLGLPGCDGEGRRRRER